MIIESFTGLDKLCNSKSYEMAVSNISLSTKQLLNGTELIELLARHS